ncbi:hypothetical protein ACFRFL_11665 [Streptomyces sp. NPDC056708]|uniref:hypothetical protein n=1 Tax=unclassified Streptomyces TaxID=2593676 RepID=UPI003687ECA4
MREGARSGRRAHAPEQAGQVAVSRHIQVSMLSAPETSPPMMDSAFASAAVQALLPAPVSLTFSATRASRPHRSGGRTVGTGPACAGTR